MLRSRAAATRGEIAAEKAELDRRSSEAAALEEEARQLDAEQDRLDSLGSLQRHADEEEMAAAALDAQVAHLDAEIVDAGLRAARFDYQLATELPSRRRDLVARAATAAEAGDADVLVEVEHDLAALPAVEQRLREQADAARSRVDELNEKASQLESIADYRRRHAVVVRRQAETGELVDPEHVAEDELERWGGRRSAEFSGARTRATEVVLAAPTFECDPDAFAAAFESARRAAIQEDRRGAWEEPLDAVAALVAPVADAAVALGAPAGIAPNLVEGTLDWNTPADPRGFKRRAFEDARLALADAAARYADRVSAAGIYHREEEWPPSPVRGALPACVRLASDDFQLVADVVAAAVAARAEIAEEGVALLAAAAAGLL